MASEARVQSGMRIQVGSLVYQSQPTSFVADVAGAKGPTPGAITVSTAGTDIDLSELTTPGLCRIMNLSTVNYVTYGIWDPESSKFYHLGEALPGESYNIRLSRLLGWEAGTGTGTDGPETNRLRFYANAAACDVLVEAFEV